VVVKRTTTNYQRFLHDHPGEECLLEYPLKEYEYVIRIEDWAQTIWEYPIPRGGEGFYSVYFVNCDLNAPQEPLSFHLDLVMSNPGPSYLPIGDAMLPTVYGSFSVLYLVFLGIWVSQYLVPYRHSTTLVIHYLMGVTLSLKMTSLFFHAIELHFLQLLGHPGGWTWIYLLFSM
jgi:G protein-coupled receptor 107